MNNTQKIWTFIGVLLFALIAGTIFRPKASKKPAGTVAIAAPRGATRTPVAAAFKPKIRPTPQLIKIEAAKAPVKDYKAFAESLREYTDLRAKVLRAPEEERAYSTALSSTSFLNTARGFLKEKPAVVSEEANLQATQALIDSLKFNANGPAKEVVRALLVDGNMDNKSFTPQQRQMAARDRAELMFHYLALHPEDRAPIGSKMKQPNARTVFAAVQVEHSRNIASSQKDTMGR